MYVYVPQAHFAPLLLSDLIIFGDITFCPVSAGIYCACAKLETPDSCAPTFNTSFLTYKEFYVATVGRENPDSAVQNEKAPDVVSKVEHSAVVVCRLHTCCNCSC